MWLRCVAGSGCGSVPSRVRAGGALEVTSCPCCHSADRRNRRDVNLCWLSRLWRTSRDDNVPRPLTAGTCASQASLVTAPLRGPGPVAPGYRLGYPGGHRPVTSPHAYRDHPEIRARAAITGTPSHRAGQDRPGPARTGQDRPGPAGTSRARPGVARPGRPPGAGPGTDRHEPGISP